MTGWCTNDPLPLKHVDGAVLPLEPLLPLNLSSPTNFPKRWWHRSSCTKFAYRLTPTCMAIYAAFRRPLATVAGFKLLWPLILKQCLHFWYTLNTFKCNRPGTPSLAIPCNRLFQSVPLPRRVQPCSGGGSGVPPASKDVLRRNRIHLQAKMS